MPKRRNEVDETVTKEYLTNTILRLYDKLDRLTERVDQLERTRITITPPALDYSPPIYPQITWIGKPLETPEVTWGCGEQVNHGWLNKPEPTPPTLITMEEGGIMGLKVNEVRNEKSS